MAEQRKWFVDEKWKESFGQHLDQCWKFDERRFHDTWSAPGELDRANLNIWSQAV
jgi:hypothetical protein